MKKDVFEELVVVKRSGQRVNFNNYKIAVAIKHAFDEVYHEYDEKKVYVVYEDVLEQIESSYEERKTINVEDIQDIIETKLKENKFNDVHEAFHAYREKRALSRKVFTQKAQHKFVKAMERIASDNSLKEDNNLKPNEILLKYGRTVANEFNKSYIIDMKYLRAHEEGNIFIGDMEDFPLGIVSDVHLDLKTFLEETNSINALTSLILSVNNEVKGEINLPKIDYLLETWLVRQYHYYYKENIQNYTKLMGFDKYLNLKKINEIIEREKEIVDKKYDLEQFSYTDQVDRAFHFAYIDCMNKISDILSWKIHKLLTNLNANQKPRRRISISFGTNNSLAGNLINNALLDVLETLKPLKKLKLIFKVKKTLPNSYLERVSELIVSGHDIAVSFIDSSFNKGENEVEYFANAVRIYENFNGEQASSGRMIIGETSVNMSRLGLKYRNKPKTEFYKELDEILELVKNELLLTFEMIGNKTKDNYQILFHNNILDDEKLENSGKIRKVIKNGNLNIGVVGLKECVMALESNNGKQQALILEILTYLNKKCQEFINETKLNFALTEPFDKKVRKELIALDKAIYGEIKNITNKSHYELVSDLASLKDDFNNQAKIQKLFNGGSMLRITLPKNITSKKLSKTITELIVADIGFIRFEHREDVEHV